MMTITPATKEKLKSTGKTAGAGAIAIAIAYGVLRLFGFKVDVKSTSKRRR